MSEHAAEKDVAVEWGVRFPSGAVESYGSDEAAARRFALTTTTLRPDLPTLVVRQVVTPWEIPDHEACLDYCVHDSNKCCGCGDGPPCVTPPAAWDDPDPDDPPATLGDDPMWGRFIPPGTIEEGD